VPIAHAFLNNVLVLEFIGKDNEIAPPLKDCLPKDKQKFFDKTVEYIRRLYKAGLVHADLSAFNILNLDDAPVFIDMSQCTTTKSLMAMEYLNRDIRNICTFFRKIGLKADDEEVKKKIVG